MEVTISNKYQVVIPKTARKKLNLGRDVSHMVVKNVTNNEITFAKVAPAKTDIMRYAGISRGAWGKDPVATLRKMRNEEWE